MAEASDRKGAGEKTSSTKRDQRSVLHEQEPDDANSNDLENGDGRRERRRAPRSCYNIIRR